MNFFKHKKKCAPSCGGTIKFTEILGAMLAIIGAIIIVQLLPIRIWMFILGLLLIILGCTLIRLL